MPQTVALRGSRKTFMVLPNDTQALLRVLKAALQEPLELDKPGGGKRMEARSKFLRITGPPTAFKSLTKIIVEVEGETQFTTGDERELLESLQEFLGSNTLVNLEVDEDGERFSVGVTEKDAERILQFLQAKGYSPRRIPPLGA